MDYKKEDVKRKTHPRDKASYLSLFTFALVLKIYQQGYRKCFQENTLPKIIKSLKSHKCGNDLEQQWRYETSQNVKPSILRMLMNRYFWTYSSYCFILLIWKLFKGVLEPSAMMNLIVYFKEGQTQFTRQDATYYAVLVLFLYMFDSFVIHNVYMFTGELCIEMRTGLSSLIYRKMLKLKPEALSKISVGNIVTLITKDIGIVENAISYVNITVVGIVQICLVCYMLYGKLGYLSIGGIGFFILTLIIQVSLGKIISNLRVQTDKLCDERLEATKQTISAIKLIKMYTWEFFFYSKISQLRRKEMTTMLKEIIMNFLLKVIGRLCVSLSVYILIMTHVWLNYSITTEVLFFILSCFRQVNILLVRLLPSGIGKFSELYGACSRIENMLCADELDEFEEQVVITPNIILKGVSVDFCEKSILKDISFEIGSCGLIGITGSIGSGKSSLLKAILREYSIKSGALNTSGRISYASQDPWIFPSTIRQNIIFGNTFHLPKYQSIIEICALDYDLKRFNKGDETILLENGANLSKGQQIRINLARALYRDAEIYLLDDCLSSLDLKINQSMFHHLKLLLKNKLCLFVTQNSSHLQSCDKIVILENGRMKYFGEPYKKLNKNKQKDLVEVLNNSTEDKYENGIEPSEEVKLIEDQKTTYFEEIVQGGLPLKNYYRYVQLGRGFCIFLMIILLYFVNQVSQSMSSKLLTHWVDAENKLSLLGNNTNDDSYDDALESKNQTILLYSICIGLTIILSLIKTIAFFDFARVASVRAHDLTIKNILNAEMKFFDTHLIGNILNRFSQDMNNIDEYLPARGNEFLNELVSIYGILLLVTLVNWTFLIPMNLCLIIVHFVKIFALPVCLNLKRLESSTKSPVVGYINATMSDLMIVRSSRCQKQLIQEFDKHLDQHTCVHYTFSLCQQALGVFIDLITFILMAFFVLYFLVDKRGVSGGDVGLVLVQVFSLNGHLQWGLRMWAIMQTNITSVERILEYSSTKQEEKTGITSKNWLKNGRINYHHIHFTYPNSKEVILKNINVTVEPNDKIGVIGRTGSGKSTFISALFRLYHFEGRILIDEVDTKSLNLKNLREHIDVIPQKPLLFSGTLRENLDPLNDYDDEKIWSVIKIMKLKTFITNIYTQVDREGSNFTAGEKQLLCFASALLRDKKIIIFDEISSNMDEETEEFTADLIKQYFKEKTVIIIAHRLKTIMECNKIVVFENGEIIESGGRDDLLQMKNGYLSSIMNFADKY